MSRPRFATAYNAALRQRTSLFRAEYRVTPKTGHHKIAFESARLALGSGADMYTDYFDTCRRKRNVIDYTRSHVATDTEADENVDMATGFDEFVEAWIDARQRAEAARNYRNCRLQTTGSGTWNFTD